MDETSDLEAYRAATTPEPEPLTTSFIPLNAPEPPPRLAQEPAAPRPAPAAASPSPSPAPRPEPSRTERLYDFLAKGFSGPEFQSTGERVVNPDTGRVIWGSSDNPADFVRADKATQALRLAAETRAEAPPVRTERAAPAARTPERVASAPMAYAPAPSAGGTPLLRAISSAESNNRPTAQNPRSSAGGLFQFTDGTWGSVLRRMAPDQYGNFNNRQLKPLKTRVDTVPLQQQAANFHLTRDILPALKRAEIPTTPGNIYLAWFQGPAGAVRAYSASPNATVAEVFPKTVVPNANLRFNGKPYAEWTMNDLRTWADRTVSSRMRADGGRVSLLQDEYPTQYLPNVGRQVMALGGVLKEEEDPVVKGALNLTAPGPKRLTTGEIIDFGGDDEEGGGPLGGILDGAFTAAPDVGSAISIGGEAPSTGGAPTSNATPGVVNSDVTDTPSRGSGLTRGITVDNTPSARGDRPGWAGSLYSDMVDPDGLMTPPTYNFGVEPPGPATVTPYSFAENTALSGLPGTPGYGAQVGGLFSGTTSMPSSTPSAEMAGLYGSMGPATVGPSVGPYSFGFIDAKSEDRGELPGISTSPLSSSIGPYSFGMSMLGATPAMAAPTEEATPPAEDPATAVAAPSIGSYAFGPLPDTTYAESVAAQAAPVAEAEAPGRSGQDKFNSMMESVANSLLAGAKTSDLTARGMALPDVSPTTYTSIANSFVENQALLDQYANPENYNMGPDPNAPAPNAEESTGTISGANTIGALAEALGANQAADAEGMAAAAANEAAAAEAAATADAVSGAVSSAADMSGLSDASGNWGGGWGSGPGEGTAGEGGQGPGGEGQGGQGASSEGAAGEGGQGAGGQGASGEGAAGEGGQGAGGEGAAGEGGGGSAGDGAGDSGGGGGGGEGGEGGGGGGSGGGGGGDGEAAGGRIVDRALRLTARKADGGSAEGSEEPRRASIDDVLALVSEGDRNAQINDVLRLAQDIERRERRAADVADLKKAASESFIGSVLRSIVGGAALPGDVAAGRVDPTSIEGIERAADLAGLVTGGSFAAKRPAGSVGMGGREDLDALMAQARARLAERDNLATELAATNKPLRMEGPSGMSAVVQKDMSREDGWRVTRLDDKGPIGHSEYNNAYDAFYNALSEGFKPIAAKSVSEPQEVLTAAGRYVRPRSPEQAAMDIARLLQASREKEITDSLLEQADPRLLYELYASGRTGADMPMDYASRMARAADQGFDRMIYRGTQSREALNRSLQTNRLEEGSKTFGTGSWASNDPDVAGTYSGLREFSPVTVPLIVRGKELRDIPWAGGLWSEGPGGQTTDRVARSAREAGDKGLIFSNITDIGPNLWNRADTQKRLPDTSDTVVIFDPSIVRSPFARFDPRLEHLLDLNRKDGGRAIDSEELDTGNAIDYSRHREGGADDMLAEALRVAREMQSPGRR